MSATAPVESDQEFDQFIFQRELNEVYLLIDYLSGRPDKTLTEFDNIALADLDADTKLGQLGTSRQPAANNAGGESPFQATPNVLETSQASSNDVLTSICLLRYPPDGVRQLKAENAAFLLRVRDRLNLMAHPASGMTIAFTAMVAGSMTEPSDQQPGTEKASPTRSRRASRATLAFQAYPGLRRRALQAKVAFGGLIAVALATAIITVWLSGEVAFAKSLLDRYVVLDNQRTALNDTIAEVESDTSNRQPATDAAIKGSGVSSYCPRPGLPSGQDHKFESYTQQHICVKSAHLRRNIEKVQNDLRAWLTSMGHFVPSFLRADWIFDPATQVVDTESRTAPGPNDPTGADNADRTFDLPILVSSLLTVVGTYLLPMFYGFLGSAASVIRDFSRKMRDSTFAPRDLTLTVVRLALGILAGASVGLFFTPGTPQQDDILPEGSVALSASALAFLAGYGVEVLFLILDSAIDRIFKRDPKAAPPNKPG